MTRAKRLSGLVAVAVLALGGWGFAVAQQNETHHQDQTGMAMPGAHGESSAAYMQAMDEMMQKMQAMEMTGDPGTDFAMMMIPHHQSAIDMAQAYLEHGGDDPALSKLAQDVMRTQQEEIEFLESWLSEHGRQ